MSKKFVTVASKDTGNYLVEAMRDDDVYFLRVRYTGVWGTDYAVDIDGGLEDFLDANYRGVDPDNELVETDALAVAYLDSKIGDLDVVHWLAEDGYDMHGNVLKRR